MLNQATLIGRVGADPEQKTTKSGATYVRLSLATSERWKDKATGEKREDTTWHNVIVWPEAVQNIVLSYVKKGDPLTVIGKIVNRSWEDENGVKKFYHEITVAGFTGQIILMPNNRGNARPDPAEPTGPQPTPADMDDEVPF